MTEPYEKKIKIGYSTIDLRGNLKIVSIMNFLQDAASEHAAQMGVSGFDLARKNLAWVIFRYHIDILHHPAWQDSIHIRTFRFPHKNLYEMRNLDICSCTAGAHDTPTRFIRAKVCWVMINKENGRPVRLSRFMSPSMCESLPHASFKNLCSSIEGPGPPNAVPEDDHDSQYHFPDIEKPRQIDFQLPFKVRMHDLDLNGHVNNAIFVEWAVETVPEEILSRYTPMSIDVMFNKESLYGDTIISQTDLCHDGDMRRDQTPLTRHVIIRQEDQTELACLNIQWQRHGKLR